MLQRSVSDAENKPRPGPRFDRGWRSLVGVWAAVNKANVVATYDPTLIVLISGGDATCSTMQAGLGVRGECTSMRMSSSPWHALQGRWLMTTRGFGVTKGRHLIRHIGGEVLQGCRRLCPRPVAAASSPPHPKCSKGQSGSCSSRTQSLCRPSVIIEHRLLDAISVTERHL